MALSHLLDTSAFCQPIKDAPVAARFGKMVSERRRAGQPRPALDLLIAATASRHGLIIATLNSTHFADIPGLTVEDWGE